MNDRVVFLLTSVAPGEGSVGALYIRDCLKSMPMRQVELRVQKPYLISRIIELGDLAARCTWGLLKLIPRSHEMRIKTFRLLRLKSYVRHLERELSGFSCPVVWIISSSPEIILAADRLVSAGHDVRLMVLDLPDYFTSSLRINGALTHDIDSSFQRIAARCRKIAVVSEPMRDLVCGKNRPGVYVIPHGSGDRVAHREPRDRSAPVRIVFAGSLYCKEEWNALVLALTRMEWRCAGREIELHFVGHFPLEGAARPERLTKHSYRTFGETLDLLSTMDIGYLPYWFDPAYRLVTSTSFPGKMSAYTRAGLAILHHAPTFSSVGPFLKAHPYGVHCTSLESTHIYQSLSHLIEVLDLPATKDARATAYNRYLSGPAFSRSLNDFLKSDESE